MLRKDCKRHIRDIHNAREDKTAHQSVIVDMKNGIYMVNENVRGPLNPVHVVVKTSGSHFISCDSAGCAMAKKAVEDGGAISFMCSHVYSIQNCKETCGSITLEDSSLQIAVNEKILGQKTVDRLKDAKKRIEKEGNVVLACWRPEGDEKLFMSVYSHSRSMSSGREVVTFHKKTARLSCSCGVTFQKCIHKNFALWYIIEKEPQLLLKDGSSPAASPVEEDNTEDIPSDLQKSKMLSYLNSKVYPPEARPSMGAPLQYIIPPDENCPSCTRNARRKMFTQKGTIYDVNWVQHGERAF